MSDQFTIPTPRVDAQGADLTQYSVQLAFNTLTAAVNSAVNILAGGSFPPSGAAGGDLSGTYPNPTVSAVHATSGTIDGVTIGALVAEPGSFTALAATSLSGLTTPLSVAQGGTGGATQATARTGLGLGSIAVLNTAGPANGGTGLNTLAAHAVLIGEGLSPVTFATPGTAGNILGSNGATADPSFQTAAALGLTGTASPAFTGTPTAPTAALHTNTTQLATTAFVENELASPPALGSTTPAAVSATTVTATGAITPSQTAGIVGTTTSNNANAGSVGEYVSAGPTTAAGITSTTATNIASISLTAGDWDVSGTVQFLPAGTTTHTQTGVGISTTSATFGAVGTTDNRTMPTQTAGSGQTQSTPRVRLSLAATTTVFLVGIAAFAVSTMTASGFIEARRIR